MSQEPNRFVRPGCRDELLMRDIGFQLSLPVRRAATGENKSSSLVLSSLSTMAKRLPTDICVMVLLELSDGLRINKAFLI
jgi:hypothetical protein